MSENMNLSTPSSFPAFPFNPPYEIQIELMRHLYSSIEEKKVTIIESPTGTGKTLSLLCASLTWLSDNKDRARKGKLNALSGEGGDVKDWVVEQTRERMRRELEADERDYEDRLKEARKREALLKRKANARVVKKHKVASRLGPDSGGDDDQFLPENEAQEDREEMNISPALQALMAQVDKPSKPGYLNDEVEPTCTKIYYASRTHSQLAQVLPELRRLKLKAHISWYHRQTQGPAKVVIGKRDIDGFDDDNDDIPISYTRAVSLGSRKQLCINDDLRSRTRDLDEGCRELLTEKRDKRCPYLPPIGEDTRLLEFRDQILASPKDIEDLATAGKMSSTCPYYGSRRAIPQAELVVLPYNLLLQKTAREALGIDLTDQIVIIDEAHNLIPTILSISTTRLPFSTLATSFQQVGVYVSKFRNRLGAENMLHLKRLVVFLDALKRYALEWKESRKDMSAGQGWKTGSGEKAEVMTVAKLLERLGRKAAAVNLLEIEAYLQRSKVARKIAGYSDKEAQNENISRGTIPPLHAVEAFLVSLTGTNEDGRVTFSLYGKPGQEDIEIKYQLLNPSPQFQDVVDVARSVVLAGGTMSPISDVVNQLFSYLPQERLSSFSCGHIIPSSSLQTLVVTKGPCENELDYKAGKQGDRAVIAELGQILLNFVGIVPGGMIVFFPSYKFLNAAKAMWKKTDYLGKFNVRKKIFFEPEETTDTDRVLQEYSAAVQINPSSSTDRTRGALLFAVIGAKLSEGLNFTDDLARAVVVVGLPFANLGSPELRERMDYVKRLEAKRGPQMEPGQKKADAELYENMCMNAVNQSIGRAIRHQGDWASLILLDHRYASSSIRNKLPKWIGSGVTITDRFGQVVKEMGTFYRNKRA